MMINNDLIYQKNHNKYDVLLKYLRDILWRLIGYFHFDFGISLKHIILRLSKYKITLHKYLNTM